VKIAANYKDFRCRNTSPTERPSAPKPAAVAGPPHENAVPAAPPGKTGVAPTTPNHPHRVSTGPKTARGCEHATDRGHGTGGSNTCRNNRSRGRSNACQNNRSRGRTVDRPLPDC